MGTDRINLQKGKNHVTLAIKVVPGARSDEITEIMADGTIKIRLSAQPVEGRANDALIKFLAQILDISRTKIEIVAGFSTRKKLVSITGLEPRIIEARIVKRLE